MTEEKTTMRTRLRAERDGFVASDPSPVAAPHWLIDRIRHDQVVAGYIAIGSEADPMHLIAAARERQAVIVLPYVTGRVSPMRFLRWDEGDPLEPGPMGLLQPCADAPEMVPDIILTPLIAFDGALHRLGQGAGHYDRVFARFADAERIGVAWSVQQVGAVPMDPWDVPLHAVVTERSLLHHEDQ